MMFKRGFIADPVAMVVLVLVLAVFGVVFFVLEVGISKDITLKPEQEYISSTKLLTVLKTPVEFDIDNDDKLDNVIVADILGLKYREDPAAFDGSARTQIARVLQKLPKPEGGGWNMRIKQLPEGKEQDYIVTGIVKKQLLKQSTIIPTENPEKPLLITLYLVCDSCTEKDLGVVA